MWSTRIRPWLIGVVCIACGLVSQAVLVFYVPLAGRIEMGEFSCFACFWYGAGLLLILTELLRTRPETAKSRTWKILGWILWCMGVLAALGAVLWSMPP